MNRKSIFKKYYKSPWHDYEIAETLQFTDAGREPDICFIYSGRNRGKSFEVTTQLLADAYYDGRQFAYVRRNAATITEIEDYFADKIEFIKDMTGGQSEGITMDKGAIKLYHYEETAGKRRRIFDCTVAKFFYLSSEDRFRSQQFPQIYNVLYEEVLTNGNYIQGEPERLFNLISTIKRNKEGFRVWLISNLVTPVNPYSNAWGIHFAQTKPGEVKLIRLYLNAADEDGHEKYYLVAAHYLQDKGAELSLEESKKKRNRIRTGVENNKWDELKLYPRVDINLLKKLKCSIIDTAVFEWDDMLFLARIIEVPTNITNIFAYNEDENPNRMPILFVERKTSAPKAFTRVYTNNPERMNEYTTRGFYALYRIDLVIDALFNRGWMMGADNLTMNDFAKCFKNLRLMKGVI